MFTRLILLAIALGTTTACTKHWDLEVTEVGKREVELYLNQPASDSFSLRGMTLTWAGHSVAGAPAVPGAQVDLGLLSTTLSGGEFLIVWEDPMYMGAPVDAQYSGGQLGYVKGIKVPRDFFAMIDQVPAMVSVSGSRTDGLVVTHKVSDAVRFGMPVADRPASGGSFTDTGTLGNPSGSAGPQRIWNGSAPQDTDSESDWKNYVNSWGVPTP